MRQVRARSFVQEILPQASVMPAGRWAGITPGLPVQQPATRRPANYTATVVINVVKALMTMVEGTARLRFVAGADPALVCTPKIGPREDTIVYRIRDNSIVTTSMLGQPPMAAVLFAARLLISRQAEFSAAYGALLDAVAADAPQSDLYAAMIHASDELLCALELDLPLEGITWFSQAKIEEELEEAIDPAALPLDRLFSDPTTFHAFQNGQSSDYDILIARIPGASRDAEAAPFDNNGFFGPQLDTAIRFMRTNRHILHHGPTGTGKSFVWELAMKAIDPEFDPNNYPYFVHGSAGLEDIDFTGNYVLHADGSRSWQDGPLVRAMKDGKRFKVEEINRLPGPMLNVLLGAMDYGRISLPRYDGQIVVAKEGFAVDAMANIGREYTATEEIDPAIMRRFQIKIEYDFLDPKVEAALIRSRYPSLNEEDVETLVRIANAVREAYEFGGGSDLDVDLYVSTAALLESASLMSEGLDLAEAIELTWLVEVARTKEKRQKVRDMIDQNVRDTSRVKR